MSDKVTLTIERVRVLIGHTDPDSAYVVDDYPYGRRLRCKIRYWIETKPKFGQRWMSQTTNPKQPGHPWNKPKGSTYSALMVMYLDEKGHVQAHGVPLWITGSDDTRVRHMGVYDALSDDDRTQYDAMLRVSRKANPTTWSEWHTKVELLADFIAATGEDPALKNGVWTAPDGGRHYLSDPAAYVTAARDLIAERAG